MSDEEFIMSPTPETQTRRIWLRLGRWLVVPILLAGVLLAAGCGDHDYCHRRGHRHARHYSRWGRHDRSDRRHDRWDDRKVISYRVDRYDRWDRRDRRHRRCDD